MKLPLALRLAIRELRGGLRGFRIFIACLVLGVAAIAAVGSIRESISAGIAREGASLLGGDAEIELTYRFAGENERAWMEDVSTRVSEIVDFRSMAVAPNGERGLTQVKAVDGAYPLLGEVRLDPAMPLGRALDGRDGLPGAVMDPLLIDKMELAVGDSFRLGTREFRLMAALVDEPDDAIGGFGLGPRSMVRLGDLDGSGLLEPGTLFSSQYRLDLPPGTDPETVKAGAEEALSGSGLRWRDARNGAPGVAEFVDRLGAFLVLVGLSGLAVGGVGISAAIRAYLSGKTGVIATLRTLGAGRRLIFLIYLIQIGLLGLVGIAAGLLLGAGLPILLAPVIEARLPVPAVFTVHPAPLAEAAIYGALTALIFTLWPLARTGEVRAAALFRDALDRARILPPLPFLLTSCGLVGLLLVSAIRFSGEAFLTLWTAGGIAGALAILAVTALFIGQTARLVRPAVRHFPPLAWALGAIGGPRSAATPVVLSLGLGLSVLAAVGQIDGNLRGAITRELPKKAPAFFFVDLQKDQMPAFRDRLQADPDVTRIQSAPMLRGIITRINGRPAREVAGDHWVLEGDRGVTYAGPLPETTTITAGEWWGPAYDGAPQVSFAAEEAAEMGLSLGDEITVNILGRDITATLTSFREVDFSTAGIGFIMAMNPAALSGAPHSFIATVYADRSAEGAILRDVTGLFPNVTAIRVRDAISRVEGLLAGLAAATSWGASVTLLTGFLVLIGAAAADSPARVYEAAILKTLGASRASILQSLALRAALLGAAAGAVALGAGILGGWAVSRFVMDTQFTVIWPAALAIVGGGIVVTLLAGLAFAWPPLAARPARVLRGRE
ncbi:drug:proton antiporter [Roseovarius sp. TE539]|uniref:ABC transporter permease n=1 Tax=Roseovarius sp. TE539 TaxID=2249812 RepID=UPI000DE15B4E|nr:FtsX-like permease family protein [Roseovarius sp. TE539]RBI71441.1 drug:proton antiporter [Roseovarius sp. TE539]